MKDECYEFLKTETGKVNIVGFGSYGEVKLAKNTQNNEVVAIKMIYNKNAKQEIDVHHKLNHPNIIKLINYYYEKEKNTTYMVLEYASGGSLNEKIKFGYGQLNKQLVKKYFRDICEAVKYLHENNFMHRDIKPENILITKDSHAKLCDFGFASILEYRSTLCGTFEYMAPEMIQKKPYDYKIDIWALGILLFELIQGYAPFRGDTGEEVIGEMKKPLIFSNRFDSVEIDLIKKILRVNAENRLEIAKILEHAYFSGGESLDTSQDTKDSVKEFKEIKEVKESLPIKELKELKIDNPEIGKKKEGERKFDFLHRKNEGKPADTTEKGEKVERTEKPERKESMKDLLKDQLKKQELKKEFKPYVPPNLQNQKNIIRSPAMKPISAGGFMPLSPQGFQQHPHQFNSSLQVPPSHIQGSTYNSNSYQYSNPNASMTQVPNKYFPAGSQPNMTQIPPQAPYTTGNFSKPTGPGGFFIEQRSPTQQFYAPPSGTMPVAPTGQTYQNFQAWKKP